MHRIEDIPKNRYISFYSDEEWVDHTSDFDLGKVVYSPQYSDETFIFRHVKVSQRIMKRMNEILSSRPSKLLTIDEVTAVLGIPMSLDWQHYATHTRARVLLFKRLRRREAEMSNNIAPPH